MPPVPDFSDHRVCAHMRHLCMTAMRQASQTRAGTKSHTRQHEKCDSMITDCFPIQCPENAEACSSRMRLPLTSIGPLSGCLAAITWEPCRSPPILLQCNAGLLSQTVCPLSARTSPQPRRDDHLSKPSGCDLHSSEARSPIIASFVGLYLSAIAQHRPTRRLAIFLYNADTCILPTSWYALFPTAS